MCLKFSKTTLILGDGGSNKHYYVWGLMSEIIMTSSFRMSMVIMEKKTNNLVEFDGTANMKEPNNAISF